MRTIDHGQHKDIRGKESAVLDLATPAGRAALRALIAEADVLIQNLKPGALDRMRLGVEALCREYPRLIACSISGYGEAGPLASRKAYDLLKRRYRPVPSLGETGKEAR